MQADEILGLAFPDASFEQKEQAIAVLNGEHCEVAFKFDDGECPYEVSKQMETTGSILAKDLIVLPRGERECT